MGSLPFNLTERVPSVKELLRLARDAKEKGQTLTLRPQNIEGSRCTEAEKDGEHRAFLALDFSDPNSREFLDALIKLAGEKNLQIVLDAKPITERRDEDPVFEEALLQLCGDDALLQDVGRSCFYDRNPLHKWTSVPHDRFVAVQRLVDEHLRRLGHDL